MKYSVHGFSQARAVELGLTNNDLLVLRWFVDFAGTKKMKTIIEEDGIYYWFNYQTILEDLPILNVKKDSLRRTILKNLCDKEVLKHKHILNGGSFSYYAYGINYDSLIYLQDIEEKTQGVGNKIPRGTEENTEGLGNKIPNKDNNTINESIINNKEKKETEIDKLINDNFTDKELKKTIYEFIKMRKSIKKPLTTRGLELIISKLNKMTNDVNKQILILNNSIMNNWLSVYELKQETNISKKKNFQTYNQREYENLDDLYAN